MSQYCFSPLTLFCRTHLLRLGLLGGGRRGGGLLRRRLLRLLRLLRGAAEEKVENCFLQCRVVPGNFWIYRPVSRDFAISEGTWP